MVDKPLSTPLVTVIITTRNEEKNIAECLHAVHAQTVSRDQIELLLIDNASTDRTVELAKPHVDAIFTQGPERSAQRNYGVQQAHAPYVLYLDADMRLSPGVVQECLEAVRRDNGIAGIYIPEKVVGSGFWIRVRNFERSFYDATVIDAVRFIKRDLFLSLGGFDGTLCGPEDWDLDRRLMQHGTLYLVTAGLSHDEGAFSFSRYLRKKTYYAQSFEAYARKWNNDAVIRKQLGLWYRYIGVFVEHGKWRQLIRLPLLAAGMYILRFLVGCSFIYSKCAKKS
jgi:glycosyltransferase involved in cell wall biosynthesis